MTPSPEQLAQLVEAANWPSRELDEAIEKALPCGRRFADNNPHAPPTLWNERGAAFHGARIGDLDNCEEYVPTRYTGSVDAAMSLVPEGWEWSVFHGGIVSTKSDVAFCRLPETDAGTRADAATPALALVASALRALAQKEGKE